MTLRPALFALAVLLAACGGRDTRPNPPPALHEAAAGLFRIGAALNEAHIEERDAVGVALVERHFDSITPENVMKWERIHPRPDGYDFRLADRFVEFGERRGQFIVGHTLVWHSQVPDWVFQDEQGRPIGREALRERLRDHIFTVVGRYRGRVHAWDVVNEALDDDGTLRQSPWLRILGEGYIADAFRWAHEADPEAELYYNDYSLELPAKRAGALALIERLKAAGVPIHGIGTQGHFGLDYPDLAEFDATLEAFGATGLKVMVTELDVDVLPAAFQYQGADIGRRAELRAELDPWTDGLPESMQARLAERYRALFQVMVEHHAVVDRVTFWGVRDSDSWKNDWPVAGRHNHPLLFDRSGAPKPAFWAVLEVLQNAPRP